MNGFLKYGLIFAAGVAVGVLSAKASKNKNSGLRPLATDIVSKGLDIKDVLMGKVEVLKESVEDIVAEAQHNSELRKMKQDSESDKA